MSPPEAPRGPVDPYTPAEMAGRVEAGGLAKAALDTPRTLALAMLAGAFVASADLQQEHRAGDLLRRPQKPEPHVAAAKEAVSSRPQVDGAQPMRRRKRSLWVTMPTSRSPSTTGRQPIFFSAMRRAASATGASGATLTTESVISSLTGSVFTTPW